MTADGELDYAYDAQGRLAGVADASTEETIATYAYDHLNRRVRATEGTQTTYFHYDGGSALVLAETDGAGATLATYTYDAAGQLHSMTRDGATYYYHLNARGDVVAPTDEDGEIVAEYGYDPYGNPTSATEGVDNPYRYAGYRYDEATGLYYCWNRYYDPETYRFITRDIYPGELADPQSMNAYAYCAGDPVNWVDPEGLRIDREGGVSDGWSEDSWHVSIGVSLPGVTLGVAVDLEDRQHVNGWNRAAPQIRAVHPCVGQGRGLAVWWLGGDGYVDTGIYASGVARAGIGGAVNKGIVRPSPDRWVEPGGPLGWEYGLAVGASAGYTAVF